MSICIHTYIYIYIYIYGKKTVSVAYGDKIGESEREIVFLVLFLSGRSARIDHLHKEPRGVSF